MFPYLAALGLTVGIEVPLYTMVLGLLADVDWRAAAAAGAVVNLISHPILTAVLVPVGAHVLGAFPAVIVGEIVVCALEATLACLWLRRRYGVAVLASLLSNSCSFLVGLAIFSLR
ncbi:MAG TPA: hypothetical protein VGR90_03235 [Acidimicrobiales bacterium]|nr:hypothetical protein [Acidimicrobiales bacterium]